MKISIISDVHIKKTGDDACCLLLAFLKSSEVKCSQKILLLGDIFDLMIGNHQQYLTEFKIIFDEILKRMTEGIKIYYFEGNHDFHLSDLFKTFCEQNSMQGRVKFIKTFWNISINEKEYLFCHGDDIEIGNYSYKIYKSLINNRFMSFIADEIFTYEMIKFIGDRASKISRKRNTYKYSYEKESSNLKMKYREASEKLRRKLKFDYLVCGHSHIKDDYQSLSGFRYLNNGFALSTKSFIFFDGNEFSFIPLTSE